MTVDKARIWFFTDIHGSDECFRKFLATVNNPNHPNVLIIGGDITGKQIVPLVENESGAIGLRIGNDQLTIPAADLAYLQKQLSNHGYYPHECDEQEYRQIVFDVNAYRELLNKLTRERLEKWVTLADNSLPPPEVCKTFVNSGNDDPFFVDEILDKSKTLQRPEGKIVELPAGLKMLSTGYSNITPWRCPRDTEEEALASRIAEMTAKLSVQDRRRAIFNFHCPPRKTALDLAFKINKKTLRPYAGFKGAQREHVGSRAVRKAIEVWQPLVGLHGHIHEVSAKDRIGDTVCFNPGSDYRTGHLQGVFLQINHMGTIEADVLTHERDPQGIEGSSTSSWVESLLTLIPFLGPGLEAQRAATERAQIREAIRQLQKTLESLGTPQIATAGHTPSTPSLPKKTANSAGQ